MRRTYWARPRRSRSILGALATLAAIALIAALAAILFPPAATLAGRASAVDGDTLRIEGTSIRLLGLDAVELDQTCTGRDGAEWPCGREARAHLAALVDRSTTMCVPDGRDRYGRVLARCSVGDEDVGDSVVRGGWALAEIEYGLALADARLKGRGIWAGAFIDPAQWRRDQGADGFDLWGWLLGWLGR